MADENKTVPTPPFKTPAVGPNGFFTTAWMAYFRQSFNRIGGPVALTNVELENVITQEVTDDIDQLQTDVALLNAASVSQNSRLLTLESQVEGLLLEPMP